MVKKNLHIVFFFFLITSLYSQHSEIRQKNSQLSNIQNEISNLEKILQQKTSEEKKSLKALSNLKEQSLLINRLIRKLEKEEKMKERSISNLNNKIKLININITNLRKEYSQYIKWLYKNGRGSLLKFLFDASSINQALIRYHHLSYITSKNEGVLDSLKNQLEVFKSLKLKVKSEIFEKEKLISVKFSEQNRLAKVKENKEILIKELQDDQESLEKEITEKRLAEVKIKRIITRLNEEERKRKELLRTEKLKNKKVNEKLLFNYDGFENFAALKGKITWPVANGKVTRSFGENKNTKLNTITLNYGVDISTDVGSNVFCVAEGRVSAIDWIPGFGSIIIVTHKDEYRTVYGHVTNIQVSEGETIKGGTQLGNVVKSLEGSIIHFEIWNERKYLNPSVWLSKK